MFEIKVKKKNDVKKQIHVTTLLVWCEGKALGYRSGGHAFKPCHRTYTLCIAG